MARKEDYWTADQEAYLAESWGTVCLPTIAEKLGKSKNAVTLKKNRMGLGAFLEAGEYVSLSSLMQVMRNGVQSYNYQLVSWVQNRGLPVRMKRVDNNRFRVVRIDEFWKWAEQNRSFIDFTKLEPNLLGAEPDWVRGQRKLDATENRMRKTTQWTREEDAMLKNLVSQYRYTYSDIARRLRRSEGAVVRRISSLGIKERPLRPPPHSPWQDWQRKLLPELIMQGTGYGVMSQRIQKSEKSIRGYVFRIYGTEVLDKARSMIRRAATAKSAT